MSTNTTGAAKGARRKDQESRLHRNRDNEGDFDRSAGCVHCVLLDQFLDDQWTNHSHIFSDCTRFCFCCLVDIDGCGLWRGGKHVYEECEKCPVGGVTGNDCVLCIYRRGVVRHSWQYRRCGHCRPRYIRAQVTGDTDNSPGFDIKDPI